MTEGKLRVALEGWILLVDAFSVFYSRATVSKCLIESSIETFNLTDLKNGIKLHSTHLAE